MANIQDVSFINQTPKSPFDPTAELDIKRRRKMADAMMKAGEQPQSTEMVSGVAVKQSPLAALAKALTQGVAGYQEGQADQQDATLQTNRQKMMADAIGQVGTNPNGAAAALAQTPETAPAGMQIALEMMKDKKALELAQFKAAHGGEGGTVAAPLQLANEYQKARASGDQARMNDLTMFAKALEKGQTFDSNGQVTNMGGFVPSVSTVTGAKQDAKNQSDLNYANPTAQETAVGKATGEAKGAYAKKDLQATDNNLVINEILKKDKSGRDILDKATGSGVGTALAVGKGVVGMSDESTQANSQLAIYGGQLLNNVPRMEGPQSDADVRSYKEQAGKIADRSIPAGDKRAALVAIQKLKDKYAAINGQMPNQAPVAPSVDYKSKYGLQ